MVPGVAKHYQYLKGNTQQGLIFEDPAVVGDGYWHVVINNTPVIQTMSDFADLLPYASALAIVADGSWMTSWILKGGNAGYESGSALEGPFSISLQNTPITISDVSAKSDTFFIKITNGQAADQLWDAIITNLPGEGYSITVVNEDPTYTITIPAASAYVNQNGDMVLDNNAAITYIQRNSKLFEISRR